MKLANVNGSVSKAAPSMAEVPGTSSETITETVQTSTPPPPQQVNDEELVAKDVLTVLIMSGTALYKTVQSYLTRRRPRYMKTALIFITWFSALPYEAF